MNCEEALKIAKTMKRNYVYVTPTRMYGLDVGKCALSTIDMVTDLDKSFAGEVVAILDEKKRDAFLKKNTTTFLNEYKELEPGFYINFWDEPGIISDIMNAYNALYYNTNRNTRLLYSISGLETNPDFMKNIYGIKTDDGYRRFILDGYYLDCFTKMHCVTKSDKVSLNIYDYDHFSYMYEFIIDKKKYVVKEYFKIRKLIKYSLIDMGV